MISYELAKKLKEAGFPQFGKGFGLYVLDSKRIGTSAWVQAFKKDGVIYEPTLSELIEACPKFRKLKKNKGNWIADSAPFEKKEDGTAKPFIHGTGSTPEEAVAALYLKLHAKD